MDKNFLVWDEKYSVKVKLIDDQHKVMFEAINMLIEILSHAPTKEEVDKVVQKIVIYKKSHFATEERYFDQFGYEGAEEHKAKHREFNQKLDKLVAECGSDSITFAYKLVDFLEDWLLGHLMNQDQKYVDCFVSHGLK